MKTESREMTVGFVGLGMMGGPMAENIVTKGHPLIVCDLDPIKVDRFRQLGAKVGATPAEVASRARVVISMVDTTAQSEEVIVGSGGFIDAAQPGDLVISMSTIDPLALRVMREKLVKKGVELIDAPVSGMEKGAIEGTLRAFVGGTPQALDQAQPVLEAMCAEVIHFGGIGNGTAMKLVNNMLFQVNRILVAEALVLGAKAGLDPQQMVDTVLKSTGNSKAFEYSAPRILARDFSGIRMDITYKDIELQGQLAKSLKVPMFMGNIAQQVYQMARACGLGDEDGTAVVKVYEQYTGVPVAAARR